MTLGPANPIKAFGSAMTISAIKAKLAETPPIVGSVRIEMKGIFFFANLSIAAVVFAICIKDIKPSCILAPPLAVTDMKGMFFSNE